MRCKRTIASGYALRAADKRAVFNKLLTRPKSLQSDLGRRLYRQGLHPLVTEVNSVTFTPLTTQIKAEPVWISST
jgi:hypothetical protein